MSANQKEIQQLALAVLEGAPNGIRWVELLRAVEARIPDTAPGKIQGYVHRLLKTNTDEIQKIARGTYRLTSFVEAEDAPKIEYEQKFSAPEIVADAVGSGSLVEQDFYASFADWLEVNDEATFASRLGGSSLGGKWSTPDVIGVLKPRAQDIFKFEPQIVTAEIKSVTNQPVVAFGQAVAYRLFSHKVYIVIPSATLEEDMNRLKSLCSIHGVGLVTFKLNKDHPDYTVVVLPTTATPDMFYVNSMLERLKASEPKLLNKLFS